MSIQNGFNNGLIDIAIVAAITATNQSIRQAGFSDYNQLIIAINNLRAEIADCEDKGFPCEKKQELLYEYIKIKNAYDAEQQQKAEDNETLAKIIGIIACIFAFAIIVAVVCLH